MELTETMLKILSSAQTKLFDQYTIEHEPIASIELMERACRAFVEWFVTKFVATQKIAVVCGTGNNGGDGLGIARMLCDWGYPVEVFTIRSSSSATADFKANLERLPSKIKRTDVKEINQLDFVKTDVIIDAIFGSGLSRQAAGIYAAAIETINQAKVIKVSVDIPSGLLADAHSDGAIVQARYTLTLQLPKLAFFFPQYSRYVGEWILLDIGLSETFLKQIEAHHFYVTEKSIRKLIRPRKKFSHKGNFGHALLIAGSLGKMGAAVLSARAAMRSGLGLLTVHVPICGVEILQTVVPEAMAEVDLDENHFSSLPDTLDYQTIGIGPGIGKHQDSVKVFSRLLENYQQPMVIDADALNILSENRSLLPLVPKGSILTPHPKEFERLVGAWSNDFHRLEKQKELAAQLQSVIVLKGAFTSIVDAQGNVYFNSTGNPGMATGGSGDVLTGILTGLLAQGYTSIDAAILSVYLHGLAGDLAAYDLGMESLIASDLVQYLPLAFKRMAK
jgi:ADP-dependent NAD(P)H-hydrate dehydratase / NAD(P)H-hydrate epimerase